MAQLTLSDYKNNLFSNHFLEERIQDREEWQELNFEEKFDELKRIYEKNESFLTEDRNEDQTQQRFIDPVLKELGHEWTPEARRKVGSRTDGKTLNPDYAFLGFEKQLEINEDDEKDYIDGAYAVGDAKSWNKKLDKSSQDHTNPAFQIYNYVDRLRADWGILTNGKKWRLYSYEDCAADVYFEVDLENLLAGEKTEEKLEAFKYFYLFFRAESFEEGFLDEIYQESVNFAEGLEDDLEDKVYNALEVAVEGFFETNDIEKIPENIDLVHHASLIFLYRILFILNAESRNLLPTEYEAYKQAFGLTQLKRMIIDEEVDDPLFHETTVAWDNRISRLFEGIDDGYDLNETEIPAYNGGLFDEEESEENKFLAEKKLYGTYLKEILELLATSYDEEKEKRIILDYKDLNIRHLGSVYEGLLEHQFKSADERKILKNSEWTDFSETSEGWEEFGEEKRVEENELYLTNESGERKATGSYYTPEYIVEYIVENTVGPKVEEKIKEAEEKDSNVLTKILELNICDPAMGSGHFLTEATEYIAEHIVEHADLEKQNLDENEDELNWAKRQVVQNCIYGVDVNELAVELGKLSLWIETAARGKPLNFLDHHLKHGNSLIGSDFDQIFSHPTEDQKRLDSERYQFGDPQEIKESFQEQYLEIEEMPENTVEQIHEKEQAYKKFIQENVLYQQFNQLANIHTRQYFEKEANSSDYESFLINIGNPSNPFENNEWYKNAQADAEDRNYFHWQLEFPKVFFGDQNGFDAVVGNPPYIRIQRIPHETADYLFDHYETCSKKVDISLAFLEKSTRLISPEGLSGFISTHQWLSTEYGEKARRYFAEGRIEKLLDFGTLPVFPGISTYPAIFVLTKDSDHLSYAEVTEENSLNKKSLDSKEFIEVPFDNLSSSGWILDKLNMRDLLTCKFDSTLSDYGSFKIGSITGYDDAFIVTEEEIEDKQLDKDLLYPYAYQGEHVNPFAKTQPQEYLIYPYERTGEENVKLIPEEKLSSKYPNIHSHLESYKEELRERKDSRKYYARGDNWYCLVRPGNFSYIEPSKLLVKGVAKSSTIGLLDEQTAFSGANTPGFIPDSDVDLISILGIMNSSVISLYLEQVCPSKMNGYIRFNSNNMNETPIPKIEDKDLESLHEVTEKIIELNGKRNSINLNIQDYLGNYSDGKTLGDLYSPVEGLSDMVVSDTSADRDSLRIGGVGFEERNGELILKVSARYKPEDSENIDEDELDRWGYFETEKVPAMKFNVDDKMRPLIEEFVSLAVDEAGGFAGFRESATKTNSVIDRLEKLTLPKLEEVEEGLEKFIDNREEAEELEDEIQETDELIDAIVFDLYDLTEEEVETVLESLDTDEGEADRILERFEEL